MTLKFLPLTAAQVPAFEHIWLPLLERQEAANLGERCSEMIAQLERGEVSIALVWDEHRKTAQALVGWRVIEVNGVRIGEVLWWAGMNMRDWIHMEPQWRAFMKEHQRCRKIRGYGRRGWERTLRQFGYRPIASVYERDI